MITPSFNCFSGTCWEQNTHEHNPQYQQMAINEINYIQGRIQIPPPQTIISSNIQTSTKVQSGDILQQSNMPPSIYTVKQQKRNLQDSIIYGKFDSLLMDTQPTTHFKNSQNINKSVQLVNMQNSKAVQGIQSNTIIQNPPQIVSQQLQSLYPYVFHSSNYLIHQTARRY